MTERYLAVVGDWGREAVIARIYGAGSGAGELVAVRIGPPKYVETALALAARGDFLTDPEELGDGRVDLHARQASGAANDSVQLEVVGPLHRLVKCDFPDEGTGVHRIHPEIAGNAFGDAAGGAELSVRHPR